MKLLMFKFIIIICFVTHKWAFSQQDHVNDAHQHVVKQAWELLKTTDPTYYNSLEINNWIGNNSTQGPWYFGDQQRIVAGAWREDEEDVVFQFSCPHIYLPR